MAAIAHFVWQKYLDKKSGHVPTEYVEAHKSDDLEVGPLPYIFLPLLPLIFILGFSEYGIQGVKMNVNLAMFLSLFIAVSLSVIVTSVKWRLASKPSSKVWATNLLTL